MLHYSWNDILSMTKGKLVDEFLLKNKFYLLGFMRVDSMIVRC